MFHHELESEFLKLLAAFQVHKDANELRISKLERRSDKLFEDLRVTDRDICLAKRRLDKLEHRGKRGPYNRKKKTS